MAAELAGSPSGLVLRGGYIFVHITAQVLVGIVAGHWGYYAALAWGSLCMGVFLVKTLKRTLYSQTRQGQQAALQEAVLRQARNRHGAAPARVLAREDFKD